MILLAIVFHPQMIVLHAADTKHGGAFHISGDTLENVLLRANPIIDKWVKMRAFEGPQGPLPDDPTDPR